MNAGSRIAYQYGMDKQANRRHPYTGAVYHSLIDLSKLAYYRDVLGFDRSEHVPFTRRYRIRCSQCEALCINGIPCHETGCPHTSRDCRECGNPVALGEACCD